MACGTYGRGNDDIHSLTGDVPGLPDAAVHDDALVVAVLLQDGNLDDFPAIGRN